MFENIKLSFQSIFAHKMRSLLTMLGVIIGIAAVIAIVSIIEGNSEAMKRDLIGMGDNTINVVYEENNMYGEDDPWSGSGMSYIAAPPIKSETLDMIKSDPRVNLISTYHQSWGEAYHLANMSWPELYGVDQTYLELFPVEIVEGRGFTDEELLGKNQFVIINETARDELFPDGFILGSYIDISGSPFRVIGIYNDRPDRDEEDPYWGWWEQSKIMIPKGIWPLVGGFDSATQIAVQAVDTDSIQAAGVMAAELLNQDLHFIDAEKASYVVMDLERIAQEMEAYERTFTFLLIGIASISLLVGGIGVMNIMLVSVTERTREIGIKKALGAKRHVILFQFLTEASVLTSLGGAIGIGVGVGVAKLISHFYGLPFMLSIPSMLIGLGFSMVVGIIFGLLPSLKASKLQPVEALRYE
ncbi:ABC transporter permease [Alkalihalobacillus pseudalcaliphilus]|uniref:ABC transporter permease n=1 Tax=Alkalihalobacillus pseudalcaliphilus TaxID=79884 RepID=UPI00064DFDEF|nr:ABC transporter permease [Alkalihalobacillus pseudalcaliphilus]KMK75528.1 peptide ABC transporter permease [Alkalihalobacillus pseudalcaliphilus]